MKPRAQIVTAGWPAGRSRPAALDRLFREIGPHFATRKALYPAVQDRVRKGDAAPMALVEIIGLYQPQPA